MRRIDNRALERTSRAVVEQLRIPNRPGWDIIVASVEGYCKKPVKLVALDSSGWANVTALLVDVDEEFYIFYRAEDPFLYQRHSIFHEFGHLLLGHDCGILSQIPRDLIASTGISDIAVRAAARGFEIGAHEFAAEGVAFAFAQKFLDEAITRESNFGL